MEEQTPSSFLPSKKREISSPEVSARKRINFDVLFEELLLNDSENATKNQYDFRETVSVGLTSDSDASEDEEAIKVHTINDLQRSHEVAHNSERSFQRETKPILFSSGSYLSVEELLLYAALKGLFPSSPYRRYSAEKYGPIVDLFEAVLKVTIDETAISNYIRRALANNNKGFGKQNGILRWHYFSKFVQAFCDSCGKHLSNFFLSRTISQYEIEQILFGLSEQSTLSSQVHLTETIPNDSTKLDLGILENPTFITEMAGWKHRFDSESKKAHFYYFSNMNNIYPEIELIIGENNQFDIMSEGQVRHVHCEWMQLPKQLSLVEDLKCVLRLLSTAKLCKGHAYARFSSISIEHSNVLYRTKTGEPGAYVETMPSEFHRKIIRSAHCEIFLPTDLTISTPNTCDSCAQSEHYLRTILSRNKFSHASKFTRFDRLSYEELLKVARESSKKLISLNNKIKRLEKHRHEMENVSSSTDKDLRKMFGSLNEELEERRKKAENSFCRWEGCEAKDKFGNCETLLVHAKKHVSSQTDLAPIDKCYVCKWEDCGKSFGKRKLIERHLRTHTGEVSDQFLELLLKDQAKALSVESRQMRWHPLVIKWCLRLYNKSHASYEDLRNSRVLRLPSGRTLSDYRNFNHQSSGWKAETLNSMKSEFLALKPTKRAHLGMLLFDEVKIKEGLVFDSATWELLGFTDIQEESELLLSEPGPKSKVPQVATHVMQFFFRSVFNKFTHPCAYFLTNGVSAVRLNQLFWQGVSMLQAFGFTTILSCCDGASENRKFIKMNTGYNGSMCACFNVFSSMPLFFMSDAPHLMKKLRNNLNKSGDKLESKHYTRKLMKNGKEIVWKHVVSVYDRDKRRHCYVTPLRKEHVFIDSLTKMKVKLAVNTLSDEVCNEMERCDNDKTRETQEFIRMCAALWKVFNDGNRMERSDDARLHELSVVANYFVDWKEELQKKFKTKKEISSHFISWETMFDLQVSTE